MRYAFNPLPGLTWVVLPLVFALCATPAEAQDAARAQIVFTYENPKLQPQRFVVTVAEDGSGHFRSEAVAPPPSAEANQPDSLSSGSQDRPIHISKALREGMFATARKYKLFAIPCDDKEKNIAFQGTKTLEYNGPEGKGSCTYNWSKNSQIDKLSDEFEAVAATLDEGAKLQRRYEHGRLSLDMEIEYLDQMVHEGRALEVENIAPILQTLAGDEAVLQRVQRHARDLLQAAKND